MKTIQSLILPLALSLTMMLTGKAQSTVWLQDSSFQSRGIPGTTEFEPEFRTYYQGYDDRQRPVETISQRWDAGQMQWVDWRRRQLTYDGDNIGRVLDQYWSQLMTTWLDASERRFEYDDSGNLLRKVFRRAPVIGQGLVNDRQWIYSYDDSGNRTNVLFQRGNGEEWSDVSRQRWQYDEAGNIKSQTLQRRQNAAWNNARRRVWAYDSVSGRMNSVTEQAWAMDTETWTNFARREYINADNGTWAAVHRQRWNAETESWENDERERFNYRSSARLQERILQRWDGSEWKNVFRGGYTLDGREVNGLFERSATGGADWERFRRFQVVYDDGFRQQLSQGWQRWNPGLNEWQNDTLTARTRIFWSEQIVSSTNPLFETAICPVPNPYRLNTPVNCADLDGKETYILQLHNLMGQPVFRKILRGDHSFSISGDIPPGLYVLHWRKGAQVEQVQKLIIAE